MPTEIRVDSLAEFASLLARLDIRAGAGMRWLFRGQADTAWSLVPSLTRILRHFGVSQADAIASEKGLTGQFDSRAPILLPPAMLRPLSAVFSQWIVMQHFGAPTRLLDWTQSPYVAAYFAAEQLSNADGAVWALSTPLLFQERWPMVPADIGQALRWLDAAPRNIVSILPVVPQMDRMAAQQTWFTVSPDILADHAAIIDGLPPDRTRDRWLKLIIPANRKSDFLDGFRSMNLNAAALFPGLDGLGRWIRELAWEDISTAPSSNKSPGPPAA